MDFINLLSIVCIAFSSVVFCTHLPPDIRTCSKSDPNFNECVRSSMEETLPKLANGNKQLGVIPLEPLQIDLISVGKVPGSSVSVDQKFSNIKVHGLTKTKIVKFQLDLNNYNMWVETFIPILRTEADFAIKGQLLVFQIDGKGPSNVTMINLKTYHNLTGEVYQKKGKQYMRLDDYKITLKPERIIYKFDNILGGRASARLNQEVHKVINENSLSVFEEVRPATEHSYALIFKQIANKIFNKIPLEEIYRP